MNPAPGLDLSFSSTDADWWLRRAADGFRVCSVALWTGGYENNSGLSAVAEDNLRFARQAGFLTSGYLNAAPPDWWEDETAIEEAKKNAGAEWGKVPVMIVDWEIAGTTVDRVLSLAAALEAQEKKVAVYTAKYVWDRLGQPDIAKLGRWPVWLAQFDGNPDLLTARGFGPWHH